MQMVIEICYSPQDCQTALQLWVKQNKYEFQGATATPVAGVSIYERKGEVWKQLPETLGGAPSFVLTFTKA